MRYLFRSTDHVAFHNIGLALVLAVMLTSLSPPEGLLVVADSGPITAVHAVLRLVRSRSVEAAETGEYSAKLASTEKEAQAACKLGTTAAKGFNRAAQALGAPATKLAIPTGARIVNASQLSLPWSDSRLWLGPWIGEGMIVNGARIPAPLPGLQWLEAQVKQFGGKLLLGLPRTMEAIGPAIDAAGEIIFNWVPGLPAQCLTAQEFRYIASSDKLLSRTIFIVGSPIY
jgi:hypothetical protein